MHRLLTAAAAAAILAAAGVAPALADDYPPCATRDQDHCLAQPGHKAWHHVIYHGHGHRHHHRHK